MGVIGVLLLVLGLIIMMTGMTIGTAVRSGAVEQGGKINRVSPQGLRCSFEPAMYRAW